MDQFVVRQGELDTTLEILQDNVDSPSCQHILIVAPRGGGKTMLLARVAAELRAGGEHSKSLLPVRFAEESYEISDLAAFWLETLFHLAREVSRIDAELSRELNETCADLRGWPQGAMLEENARVAVLEVVARLDKRLVLMVENMQSLLDHTDDDFGWELRAVLQSEPRVMLLATATCRFEGLEDARGPFFELFRIINLKRLGRKDCRLLWRAISGDAADERKIRPLQILTGGNPRLLAMVAEFHRRQPPSALMDDLIRLVDDHTEYFRGRLEMLPDLERRVYLAIIDLWRESNASEIAARSRIEIRSASTMLGRLVKRGMVTRRKRGKKHFYVASERLYSIYYKLRRERDQATVARSLIHFMAAFYDPDESLQIIKPLAKKTSAESRETEHVIAALSVSDHGIPDKIRSRSPEEISVERLVLKAIRHRRQGNCEKAIKTYGKVIDLIEAGDSPDSQKWLAPTLFDRGEMWSQIDNHEEAISCFDDLIKRCAGSEMPDGEWWATRALLQKIQALIAGDRSDEALRICDELGRETKLLASDEERRAHESVVAYLRAKARLAQGERELAVDSFRTVHALFRPEDQGMIRATAFCLVDLFVNLIEHGGSERDIIEILLQDETKSEALGLLSDVLRERGGEDVRAPDEALEVVGDMREAIEKRAKVCVLTGWNW